MVAISFSVFIDKIKDGSKQQTIRKTDRNGRIKAGAKLQLYTGVRAGACRIIRDDVVCVSVEPILIMNDYDGACYVYSKTDRIRCDRDAMARADGFENWADMLTFFDGRYGLPFTGVLIKWEYEGVSQ